MGNYILRHKNIDVAVLDLEPSGFFVKKIDVKDSPHFPFGVNHDGEDLRNWWIMRIIPASRDGIDICLRENRLSGVNELALGSMGLNLTDQYWIVQDQKQDLLWEDVNFFDNDFTYDEGQLRFTPKVGNSISVVSPPDRSTGGQLPKRWIIEDGTRYLIKSGTTKPFMEPFYEKIGSAVCRRLGIEHVDYSIITVNGYPACKCACFVDRNTEFVPAYYLLRNSGGIEGRQLYNYSIEKFTEAGIPNSRRKIDEMIVTDYLLINTDRHTNNFGVIRDADTLRPLSFAPLFDSERSMWQIWQGINCQTFCKTHDEQIGLVSDFSWYDPESLAAIVDEVEKIMAENNFGNPADSEEELLAFSKRIETLNALAAGK